MRSSLRELGRLEALEAGEGSAFARVKVTGDGRGVLLQGLGGAVVVPFDGPKVPQQIPLKADLKGLERGEVAWSADGNLASTCLDGQLQLLQMKVELEEIYVPEIFEHGFSAMPRLCWGSGPRPAHLALWRPKDVRLQLWRGNGLETLPEERPLRGIAWGPEHLLAVWSGRALGFPCEKLATGALHLWHTQPETPMQVDLPVDGGVCDVAWSQGSERTAVGHRLTAVESDGKVTVWSIDIADCLEITVLCTMSSSRSLIDTWEMLHSGGDTFCLVPFAAFRLCGADVESAQLLAAVRVKGEEKVLPVASLSAWPAPRVWRGDRWQELHREGCAITVHGWSPALGGHRRWLLSVAHALGPMVGHLKRSRVLLWDVETDMPVRELKLLEDCPVHRFRFERSEGSPGSAVLACALVDGRSLLVEMDGEASVTSATILGDAWNGAAPTGARWRNWPRGAQDLRLLPCRRVAMTLRRREMAGDTEAGDAVVVYGRSFESSNYRQLMLGRSMEADVPKSPDAAIKSLSSFLASRSFPDATAELERSLRRAAKPTAATLLLEPGSHAAAQLEGQLQAALLWCADPPLELGEDGRLGHLRQLINDAVDSDGPLLKPLLVFLLSLHAWQHSLRSPLLPLLPPCSQENLRLYHYSTALDQAWQPFFREGSFFRLRSRLWSFLRSSWNIALRSLVRARGWRWRSRCSIWIQRSLEVRMGLGCCRLMAWWKSSRWNMATQVKDPHHGKSH
ncbi:unnamed protein product [Durusdinium trenchii]|uniref:Uncharacterized protein n=1 Tax=Durusdinium trenchii TaxID=1381693 RepID=A0ABP0RST5_9DINO